MQSTIANIARQAERSTRPVIISGAGPGGLALAAGLQKKNIPVHVYEKLPKLIPSSCFGLAANGALVCEAFGLMNTPDTGIDNFVNTNKTTSVDLCDGSNLATIDTPKFHSADESVQLPAFGIMKRYDFCRSVLSQLDEGTVSFSSKVVHVEDFGDRVEVEFEDGTKVEGSILVAADGVNSRIREQILPTDETKMKWSGYRLSYGLTDHKPLLDASVEIPEPGKMFVIYGPKSYQLMCNMEKTESIYWACYELIPEPGSRKWTPQPPMEECRDRLLANLEATSGGRYSPKFIEPILHTGTLVETTHWLAPAYERFHKGRIVLMGDAAHKTMPFTGQGLNMACEDSLVLATVLAENFDAATGEFRPSTDFDEVFSEYYRIRGEFTKGTQENANRLGQFQLPPSRIFQWVRNLGICFLEITGLGQKLADRASATAESKVTGPTIERVERYQRAGCE